jgi:hypothetical protein
MKVRSILSVLAGFVTLFVVTTAVDIALHAAHFFPPLGEYTTSGPLAVASAYRFVISTAGCYVAARLAPERPMRHAAVLGGIGVLLSIAGALSFRGMGPAWYPLSLVVMSPLCAWLGGRLREVELARPVPARQSPG